MAIVFEEQRKPVNWMPMLFIVFIIAFIGFATYYLFFAPTPRIDTILGGGETSVSELQFVDPAVVLNNQTYRALRPYAGSPSVGTLGRQNPFLPL
ncbi:MAG: hypothetical protein AAB407_02390 [Patescibacteria group bacterium]